MTAKFEMWQKAVIIAPILLGNKMYEGAIGKELWVLPPVKGEDLGPGRDPITHELMPAQSFLWYPTNVLNPQGKRVYYNQTILELKPEFVEQVECVEINQFYSTHP